MCGIIGYVGYADAVPILLDGLIRLEYRGYDSSGIAIIPDKNCISVRKEVGHIDKLQQSIEKNPISGSTGIGHTRWATHGKVSRENAHPHCDESGKLALVHNGVIENYAILRQKLEQEGMTFKSQTDTEVLAQLISYYFKKQNQSTEESFLLSIRLALKEVNGAYGISVIHADFPDYLVGVRHASSLILGIGRDEYFLASDISAMVRHTREVVYLNENEIVVINKKGFSFSTLCGMTTDYNITTVDPLHQNTSKGDYQHHMLKEIHEQVQTVTDAMRGRLLTSEATAKLGGLNMSNADLLAIDRLILVGCGTSYHAALFGEYFIESLAKIPVECEFASEFRYRNVPMTRNTTLFVLTQSGETADTLAALHESKRRGYRTLGICNNIASTIARETDGGIYMHAGPEISVAATKTFTSQSTILLLIALLLGRIRYLSNSEGTRIINELEKLPDAIQQVFRLETQIAAIAKKYTWMKSILFLGRQSCYPIALEGALKLKEVSYICASGHPSAELKHGIIALVNPELPSLFIAPDDLVFQKNISNIEEVKARGGPIIIIGSENRAEELLCITSDVILLPVAHEIITPILANIALQFFAYYMSLELGNNVDKPRNLAKSVTVE